MLVSLSEEWRNGDSVTVVEIGTFAGASALSMLASSAVERVTTFDVIPWCSIPFSVLRQQDFGPRLEQRPRRPCRPWILRRERGTTLADADMVFVDAAKDGVFEYRFLHNCTRCARHGRCIVVLDDVRVLPMLNLWRELPLPKLDIASFGHWSGTGLINRREAVIDWSPPPAALQRRLRPLLVNSHDGGFARATVNSVAVDDLGLGELALIKIDVEGFEPVVLDGMTATVHRSPDAYLIIEVNPLSLAAAGHTADDLLTHPVLHGHRLYYLRDAADVEAGVVAVEDVLSFIRSLAPGTRWYGNVVAVPAQRMQEFDVLRREVEHSSPQRS